jgi:hypothetical protein
MAILRARVQIFVAADNAQGFSLSEPAALIFGYVYLAVRRSIINRELLGGSIMKNLFTGIWAAIVFCGLSIAQATPAPAPATPSSTMASPAQESPANPSSPANGVPHIAPGSIIPVQLTKTIDAKKVKAGDEVDAKVTQDMKTRNGEIIVAKDTKVVGHVTEAQARTKEQKESEVGIAFDHAVMKDGTSEALPMSVQAVIARPNQTPESDNAGGAGGMPSSGASPAETAPGRSPGMGTGAAQQAPNSLPPSEEPNSTASKVRQPITANTQGIVGLSNYKLQTSGDEKQGSVVSSEKDNVKLESGTLMLLRVNQ